jgi:hypothetical protein
MARASGDGSGSFAPRVSTIRNERVSLVDISRNQIFLEMFSLRSTAR